MTEIAAMGRQGCLQDEPHSLGQVRNSLESLDSVRHTFGTGGPQSDVHQTRMMEKILQSIKVICGRRQRAPGAFGDVAVTDRRRTGLTDDGCSGVDDGLATVLASGGDP